MIDLFRFVIGKALDHNHIIHVLRVHVKHEEVIIIAVRGRKPKPTALKQLEGNPGKRPLNEQEPIPPKGSVRCPNWLEPEAKKEWKRLAPSLEAMGVLTTADLTAFAGYCQAYARWKEAEEFITQHGSIFQTPSGYVQQVPQVSIAQQNLKIMQSFCSDFGLTPATRSRIIAAGGDDNGSEDPMESVLKGGW